MKKWAAIMAASLMALSFAGCGAGDVGSDEYMASKAAASATASSGASAASQAEVAYEATLKGLQSYLADKGIVSGDAVVMESSFIGATEGVKYTLSYEGKQNVTLELYRFDPSKLNETASKVLSDVKTSGKFELMKKQVPAVLNGDFMMLYTDTQSDDTHTKRAEEVKQTFLEFQK